MTNAGGGSRTHTALPGQRILSPQRLPFRHAGSRSRVVPILLDESRTKRTPFETRSRPPLLERKRNDRPILEKIDTIIS